MAQKSVNYPGVKFVVPVRIDHEHIEVFFSEPERTLRTVELHTPQTLQRCEVPLSSRATLYMAMSGSPSEFAIYHQPFYLLGTFRKYFDFCGIIVSEVRPPA